MPGLAATLAARLAALGLGGLAAWLLLGPRSAAPTGGGGEPYEDRAALLAGLGGTPYLPVVVPGTAAAVFEAWDEGPVALADALAAAHAAGSDTYYAIAEDAGSPGDALLLAAATARGARPELAGATGAAVSAALLGEGHPGLLQPAALRWSPLILAGEPWPGSVNLFDGSLG